MVNDGIRARLRLIGGEQWCKTKAEALQIAESANLFVLGARSETTSCAYGLWIPFRTTKERGSQNKSDQRQKFV